MSTRPPTAEELADLSAWTSLALSRMPYMDCLLLALQPVSASGLGTFGVDDRMRLYIDFEQGREWGVQACAEVLLHEVGHIFGDHAAFAKEFGLTSPGQRKVWNLAGDSAINGALVEAGCQHIATTGVLPEQFGAERHLAPKTYYDLLVEMMPPDGGGGSTGQNGPDQGDQGPADGEGEDGQDDAAQGCGSGSGGAVLPGELASEDDLDGAAPGLDQPTVEGMRVQASQQILDHASKNKGSVPAGLLREAELRLAPTRTPWQRLVSAYVRRAIRTRPGSQRSTVTRRDRRRRNVVLDGGRAILPGRISLRPRVAYITDTSGSMDNGDLSKVTSEVVALAQRLGLRGRELLMLDVDAQVHRARGYQGRSSVGSFMGGGGTSMPTGIAHVLSLRDRPDVIVVGTDGHTDWPSEPTPVPLILVITTASGVKMAPPWATVVDASQT